METIQERRDKAANQIEIGCVSPKPRKILAGILVILGGLLMWLVPAESTVGLVILLLGVAIEAVGIYLEHKGSR